MALSEFALIKQYFQQSELAAEPAQHAGVALGIGDDCALLNVPADQQLAVSLDVLVSGVHFLADADAALLAQRALAVNLSDLAAMGATPLGFTLGLTLPAVDEAWLAAFAQGLRSSALRYQCPLLGGDTTRGPLQLAIQVHGLVPVGQALRRSAAQLGDDVYVSGTLGRAGLALALLQQQLPQASSEQQRDLLQAYYQPEPRLALGYALRGLAHAAQDVSDGVLADLAHIAEQSTVQIVLQAAAVPVAPTVRQLRSEQAALALALTAGDDYELIFTAPVTARATLQHLAQQLALPLTRIGHVATGAGVHVLDAVGKPLTFAKAGYDHFAQEQTLL